MSAGQTVITYGDMTITNCLTQPGGFAQEPVFDDSHTDLLYFKFRVRVVGWIHGIANVTTIGILPNYGYGLNSAARSHAGIRYSIKPRQQFVMLMGVNADLTGGVPILACRAFQPTDNPDQAASQVTNITAYDVADGPRCTRFDVIHVAADNLLKVEAEFEICKVECDSNGAAYNTSGVLNNRWSVIDDVDENFVTTRKFTGTLHTVSSIVNANSFRAYVVPPLQPGMRRQSMSFQATPDGRRLQYEIVDKETYFSAPKPATKWRIEHTEDAQRESRLAVYGTVRVELQGDRNADHKVMIPIAIAIAESKLLTKNNGTIIMGAMISSIMGSDESSVSVSVRGMRVPENADALLGVPLEKLGQPIAAADMQALVAGYDKDLSRGARAEDVIEVQGPIQLIGAFAAYLQTSCNDDHAIYNTTFSGTSQNPPKRQPTAIKGSVSSSPAIQPDRLTTDLNSASKTNLYTFYQMETSYESNGMRVHMPIGAPSSSSSSSSSSGNQSSTGTAGTSVVVDLAPRMTKRRLRISSERVGSYPDLPLMQDSFTDSNGITFTLLDTIDHSIVPDRSCDAKQFFKLDREYIYAMSRAPNPRDQIAIGVNPWENKGVYLRAFDNGVAESSFPLS